VLSKSLTDPALNSGANQVVEVYKLLALIKEFNGYRISLFLIGGQVSPRRLLVDYGDVVGVSIVAL